LRATKENRAFFEETKAKLLEENKEAIEKAEKFRTEVESLKLAVVRSASDTGILYGSVTTRDISNLISAEGVTVSRKDIALDQPIKELGIYDVNIIFHPEVESKIKLRIVRSLGDNTFETEENSITSKNSDEINESLLEDGVTFKTEEVNSEEEAPQTLPENELTEQRDGE
jgi:large subunit ribosomal protein L9